MARPGKGPRGNPSSPANPVVPGTGQRGNALSRAKLDMVLDICEAVAQGGRITVLLGPDRPEGWPTPTTWHKLQQEYPAVRDMYQNARELSAQALEDRALGVAEGLLTPGAEYTGVYVQGAGKAMEQLRWSAERRNPTAFGTKATVQTVVPIQINTTLDLGQPGGGRAVDTGNPFAFTVDVEAPSEPAGEPDANPGSDEPSETTTPLLEPPTAPDGWTKAATELPATAAKFGLTEWPASAVPKLPGGRKAKVRYTAGGKPHSVTPKGYAAERIAQIKAERKAKG